jgi:O-antigen ligase
VRKSGRYTILFNLLPIFAVLLPVSKSANTLVMGLIYVYCLVLVIRHREARSDIYPSFRQPLVIPIAMFILAAAAGLFLSGDLMKGLSGIKSISNLLLIYLMVSGILDMEHDPELRHKRTEEVLFAFIAGIYVLDLIAAMKYFGIIGGEAHTLPLSPPGMHHIWFGNLNAIGLYAALSLVFFSSFFRSARSRTALISFIAAGTLCVLFSLSRTAWAGIMVTTIVLIYFMSRDKKLAFLSVLLFLAAGLVAYLIVDIVHARIDQIFSDISMFFSNVRSTSLGGRFVMWKAAWRMFLSSPLWGVGTGDYEVTVLKYVQAGQLPQFVLQYNQPHNMYLFALAENGLLGLSALLYILYRAFASARMMLHTRESRPLGFIAMAVSCHYATGGFTESLFNIHVLICSFAFLMGVALRRSSVAPSANCKRNLFLHPTAEG